MGRLQISRFSLRLANATRMLVPAPAATDGFTSSVGPEVRRSGAPVIFHVVGEIPMRHRFLLSPERAEKTSALLAASQAEATAAVESSPSRPSSRTLEIAWSAPVWIAGPASNGVVHQSQV